jgi:ribosomal protein S18 acetylase RimI-like enzyme
MTLATLAPYRNRGIGSKLLNNLLSYFESHKNDSAFASVDEIMLHVQTSNVDAIRFYEQFGFEKGELVEGYYKRIDPPDCYVLRKKLR